ncbi:sensor histidine kinase [Novosphingobium colocasiae]
MRGLAKAMNMMQGRIAALLQEQAQSFEAISHDLRTPLARQKVLADLLDDQELASMLAANVDEMEALLASLQQFLRAQHLAAQPETVDLTELAEAIAGPFGSAVTVHRQPGFTTTTFVEPVAISLAVLIENALQYGHRADIRFARTQDGRATISVEDDGPGLSEDHFQAVLDPFFRLDQARARNTKGFGLGIPTAHRLMTRFQGDLSFARSSAGGLRATITAPLPTSTAEGA